MKKETKTKKLIAGISVAALGSSVLAGCGMPEYNLPPVPGDNACTDWEWEDDEGVWECDDDDSRFYGHYYYGGHYYGSSSALKSSSSYKSYKSSSSYKGGTMKGKSVTTKSGFGSGSRSYGG